MGKRLSDRSKEVGLGNFVAGEVILSQKPKDRIET